MMELITWIGLLVNCQKLWLTFQFYCLCNSTEKSDGLSALPHTLHRLLLGLNTSLTDFRLIILLMTEPHLPQITSIDGYDISMTHQGIEISNFVSREIDEINSNCLNRSSWEKNQRIINCTMDYHFAMPVDPVCGIEMDEKLATILIHQGKNYYFCSEGCKKIFVKKPRKYRWWIVTYTQSKLDFLY